jgi:lipid-binding SYLF domain-containing protein
VGRQTEAATDIQAKSSIYSYSMSKGLFAGVSLEGATIRVDQNANTAYWGKSTWPTESLKTPATDKRILPLIKEIETLISKAD